MRLSVASNCPSHEIQYEESVDVRFQASCLHLLGRHFVAGKHGTGPVARAGINAGQMVTVRAMPTLAYRSGTQVRIMI